MKVSIDDLRQQVHAGVAKLGYENGDAAVIAEVLLYAQLRGNNQGITKIATGGVPKASDIEELVVVRKNKCGALISGGHAMVATHQAVHMATELAEEHGVGIVGSNHTFSSSGAVGYFARRIAEAGYIGLVCVGTPPFVAPFGSAEPKLGTNPLTYGFPTLSSTVVFDTTTAAMAYFGVVEAKLKGEPLPAGIAFDQDGVPTTNAAKALEGSVTTFAEHKGFGLSLLVQLLGGPLVDADFLGKDASKGAGTFVLAIDPGLLVDKQQFLERADELVHGVAAARPLAGSAVLLPGQRGDQRSQQFIKDDEIEIADEIWAELKRFVSERVA
jgi:LDH2 family malate/lactate/ureidoglycolate dehydrogenase